jgi:hypothetical protein
VSFGTTFGTPLRGPLVSLLASFAPLRGSLVSLLLSFTPLRRSLRASL